MDKPNPEAVPRPSVFKTAIVVNELFGFANGLRRKFVRCVGDSLAVEQIEHGAVKARTKVVALVGASDIADGDGRARVGGPKIQRRLGFENG